MTFFEFLFSPQAHKFRNGYSINHDTLMNVSPAARAKLIFYFIAEQLPQKLDAEDRTAYERERTKKIGIPRTLWMWGALLAPLAILTYMRPANIKNPYKVAAAVLFGGLSTPFAVAIHSRIYQGRYVQSSRLIDELSKKYNYGIYDFSIAKKESRILNLLYTMDTPYQALHS